MAKFPGISPLLTQAPQDGINTFGNNPIMSSKTRAKERGGGWLGRGWGHMAVMTDLFQGATYRSVDNGL